MNAATTILMVEDNATTRKLFRLALEAEAYRVVEADTAGAALGALAERSFDLVLQDLILPDMHGFDLVRRIRAHPNGADVPVIAVSGFLNRLEEAQATRVGFTSLLVKPVEPSRLIQAVRQFMPGVLGDEPQGAGRVVLVVNDDPVQLKLARLRLTMLGFRVAVAEHGERALTIAHERHPDAVLSDVLMPVMDGFQLCLAIRSDPSLRHIPVVLISVHYGSASDHELAARVGANALIQGTPDFADVPGALDRAIAVGAPTPTPTPEFTTEIRLDHAGALARQLEKQVGALAGLGQRCTLLTAEVALLSGVTDALAHNDDPGSALRGVLTATLDASGISKGALYLCGEQGLTAYQAIGFDGAERVYLDGWLTRSPLVAQVLRDAQPLALGGGELSAAARDAMHRLGIESAQLVPLVAKGDALGLLVLGARRSDIGTPDAVGFGHAFAGQIAQSLELTRAFERTTEAERRLRQIAESIREAFFLADRDLTRFFYVSPAYEAIFGRSCASLYADPRSWLELVVAEDLTAATEQLERLVQTGDFDLEFRIRRPDAEQRWIRARGFAVVDAHGRSDRVAGVAEDVTEARRVADLLAESRRRLEVATDAAQLGVWAWAVAEDRMTWDARMCELYGIRQEGSGGGYDIWRRAVHPDDRARVEADVRAALTGAALHSEFRVVRPDGEVRDLEAHATVERGADGAPLRMIGVSRDITARRRAEEALRHSEASLNEAQRNAAIGSWRFTPPDTFAWSRQMYELFKLPLDRPVSSAAILDVVHPDDRRDRCDAAIVRSAVADFESEYRVRWPDGQTRILYSIGKVRRDGEGQLVEAVGTVQDVTEQRRMAEGLLESEARFRQLAGSIDTVFFLLDVCTGVTLYVSPAYAKVWGRDCASLYADPRSWADGVHPDDREQVLASTAPEVREIAFDHEYRLVRADGSMRWVRARSFPIRDATGAICRVAVTADDITDRKEQQARLARLNRFRAVTAGVSAALTRSGGHDELLREACRIAVDEGGFAMAWAGVLDNETLEGRMVASHGVDPGYVEAIRFSTRPEYADCERPASRAARELVPVIINDVATDPAAVCIRDELSKLGLRSAAALPLVVDGRARAVLALCATEPHFFEPEQVELLSWMASDLAFAFDRIESKDRLSYLAYFDPLTDLANATLFMDRLGQYLHAASHQRDRVSVALIDLVQFKLVNDALGRQCGDALLRGVGKRLADTAAEPFTLARVGADVFVLARPMGGDDATTLPHDTVADALAQPLQIQGHEIRVKARVGVAVFPSDGLDAQTLFANAETALGQAKAANAEFRYYSREVNARVTDKRALEEQLRAAVEANQFVVHFQPRLDLRSGAVVGAEALLRWQHPVDGLVLPGRFIAVAEESGLIVPIGAWIIEAVCMQQAAWLARGVDVVPVAVNLSSVQFQRGDLLKTVRDALAGSALGSQRLDLELTESAVMQDVEHSTRTVQALSALGVGLALDDFGTGYSSLAHLKRFPFDEVKIDQTFVADITHDPDSAAIATAIIAMAHRLNLRVVAEGVETEAQMSYLRRQGCDEMQGFLFSAALPAQEFEALLSGGRRLSLPPDDPGDACTLLIVDDEPSIRSALSRVLRRDGYRILSAEGAAAALELLAQNPVQVIVTDQRMPGMSGAEFLDIVKDMYPDTMRIILSGYTDLEAVTDSVNRGAVFKFLTKPWDDDLLRAQVRDAFRRYRPSA